MKVIISWVLLLLLSSCSIPHVYVIEDPLTAVQHNELGHIYETQGKSELAEKEYRRAVQKEKGWAVPYFNLGNLYFKMGDLKKAEEHYREAIEKDGTNPDFMNNLAYVLCEQSSYDEAEHWISLAISISPKKEYLDTQKEILSKKASFPLGR
jgi:Tfp pilus assembly protein PilF